MGEYALYNGERVKIGTCENMYYLRADQVHLVTGERGSVDPRSTEDANQIRFRFPFPQEDNVKPGQFEDHDYSLRLHGIEPPEEVDHYFVQLADTSKRGLLVSLPCPESKGGKSEIHKIHYNGYSGKVAISQQRLVDGKLVLVCECGSCGAKYRLPTLEDAQPVIDALLQYAKDDSTNATFFNEVAKRIIDGYTLPNYWSTVAAVAA